MSSFDIEFPNDWETMAIKKSLVVDKDFKVVGKTGWYNAYIGMLSTRPDK